MSALTNAMALIAGDRQADRVVPPSGFTAQLTLFASGAMAFLAVFALALSLVWLHFALNGMRYVALWVVIVVPLLARLTADVLQTFSVRKRLRPCHGRRGRFPGRPGERTRRTGTEST